MLLDAGRWRYQQSAEHMATPTWGQEEEEDGGTASCSTIQEAEWRHMTDSEQTEGTGGVHKGHSGIPTPPRVGRLRLPH